MMKRELIKHIEKEYILIVKRVIINKQKCAVQGFVVFRFQFSGFGVQVSG